MSYGVVVERMYVQKMGEDHNLSKLYNVYLFKYSLRFIQYIAVSCFILHYGREQIQTGLQKSDDL